MCVVGVWGGRGGACEEAGRVVSRGGAGGRWGVWRCVLWGRVEREGNGGGVGFGFGDLLGYRACFGADGALGVGRLEMERRICTLLQRAKILQI